MKIIQVLGHNFKWNIDSFLEQQIGDELLITAFTFGNRFLENNRINSLLDRCMIDLQFYGKKRKISSGKLQEFSFHPSNYEDSESTNIYVINCIKEAINYQISTGFTKIIIPLFYDSDSWKEIIPMIREVNKYVKDFDILGLKFYMTIPLAFDIIRDKNIVDEILFALTDKDIHFDGYYVVCENKPEQGHKISTDLRLITNLSSVFKTLKGQGFETIYSYANWDAIIYLAQTDIDYITIGSYENLRNFSIKRFTEDISGGKSDGYYFSERLLNMVRAKDIVNIRQNGQINKIRNSRNIFSDVILHSDYFWNIHKPDVNKNYLLSISRLLKEISNIEDSSKRILYVLKMIEDAINVYQDLDDNYIVFAGSESKNYHLEIWKQYLLKESKIKPSEFNRLYQSGLL